MPSTREMDTASKGNFTVVCMVITVRYYQEYYPRGETHAPEEPFYRGSQAHELGVVSTRISLSLVSAPIHMYLLQPRLLSFQRFTRLVIYPARHQLFRRESFTPNSSVGIDQRQSVLPARPSVGRRAESLKLTDVGKSQGDMK